MGDELRINAWIDGHESGAQGRPSGGIEDWAIASADILRPHQSLFAAKPPDLASWQSVGWGLILPDDDRDQTRDRIAKAKAEDAPEPIRTLLAKRRAIAPDSPVLRYRPELGSAYFMLYEDDGTPRQISTAGGEIGAGSRQLPRYLLIVGSPQEIPWRVQYVLNGTHFVGRLDLPEQGLADYVAALLQDWRGASASRRKVLIWAVDHDKPDITWDMRHTLAEPLKRQFLEDADVTPTCLAADEATGDALAEALKAQPGLIVTTSHGATYVAAEPGTLRAYLGRPVDQDYAALSPVTLASWSPGGAIWYAHACCSAGADAHTLFDGIAEKDSDVGKVIAGVTAAGSCTAPMPTELLGREQPLRAFVGHVEPTFNWTLKDPENGQPLTSDLTGTFYTGLFQEHGEPIGMALQRYYSEIGTFWSRWNAQQGGINRLEPTAIRRALAARMAALDRQSLVILGDPTVTVPQD